jgi:hypothetical protein
VYIHCSRGSQCGVWSTNILYFNQISPLYYSFSIPPPHHSTAFSAFVMSSLCTDTSIVILFLFSLFWCYLLSTSVFLPHLSLVPLNQSHYYKHVLKICRYDYVYICIYALGLSSTFERKHATFLFQNLAYFI